MRYYHVTNTALDLETPSVYPKFRMKFFGKPVGLWYAPGSEWIDREQKDGSRHYTFKYEFPLEGKFVENVNAPDRTKILRLTAENIGDFEAAFQPYYLGKLYKNLRDNSADLYEISITRDQDMFKGDEGAQVKQFLLSKGIRKQHSRAILKEFLVRELKKHIGEEIVVDSKTGEQTLQPKKQEKVTLTDALLGKSLGFTGNIWVFEKIRLIEYGNFLGEVMKLQWGGIDYDGSLFTPDLKAKYPFIVHVEIPSGCLWHPEEVMPGYIPTPVKGGKRTRRKRLRKSTRRRR